MDSTIYEKYIHVMYWNALGNLSLTFFMPLHGLFCLFLGQGRANLSNSTFRFACTALCLKRFTLLPCPQPPHLRQNVYLSLKVRFINWYYFWKGRLSLKPLKCKFVPECPLICRKSEPCIKIYCTKGVWLGFILEYSSNEILGAVSPLLGFCTIHYGPLPSRFASFSKFLFFIDYSIHIHFCNLSPSLSSLVVYVSD